jgi:hypothetical protein
MSELGELPGGPGAYIVRSIEPAWDGRVIYTVVDMAGTVTQVTLPRRLTLTEDADAVLRHHVARRHRRVRRP